MDNSATHDEATFSEETGTLSLLDVGLNSALALDSEMLALIAAELGHPSEAAEFEGLAEDTRHAIRTLLWDEERHIFANRQRQPAGSGRFVRSLGPTSFYPLTCGAATTEQARHLLRHMADPDFFAGPFTFPNSTRDDPSFGENRYWRGRIWPNVNWFVWQGLRRYGFPAEASALAETSMQLFMQSWAERRLCGENYHPDTGLIDDHPDNDPFYTWGALLPLLGVAEVMDVAPWFGWQLCNTGEPVRLGPLLATVGTVTVSVQDGTLSLLRGSEPLLRTTLVGRLTDLVIETGLTSCRLWPASSAESTLVLPQVRPAAVVAVRLDGEDHDWIEHEGGLQVQIGSIRPGANLSVHTLP